MTVKREDLDHVRTSGRIICARQPRRRSQAKCYACNAEAKFLCDAPKEVVDPDAAAALASGDIDPKSDIGLSLTTCSKPCCGPHACYHRGGQICRECAEKMGVWA